jgi:hypothetical protein
MSGKLERRLLLVMLLDYERLPRFIQKVIASKDTAALVKHIGRAFNISDYRYKKLGYTREEYIKTLIHSLSDIQDELYTV